MDYYQILKTAHITTVSISLILFVSRVYLLIDQSPLLKQRFFKIAPHANDSLLLISALLMLWIAGLLPGAENPWLIAKIVVMVMYILTGMSIFKAKLNTKNILIRFIVALLMYFYIIHTAVYKTINPFVF